MDCISFKAYLVWQMETFCLKLSKIVITFYFNIVFKNIACDMGLKNIQLRVHMYFCLSHNWFENEYQNKMIRLWCYVLHWWKVNYVLVFHGDSIFDWFVSSCRDSAFLINSIQLNSLYKTGFLNLTLGQQAISIFISTFVVKIGLKVIKSDNWHSGSTSNRLSPHRVTVENHCS